MDGYCTLCTEFTRDLRPCPRCQDLVGLCCYVVKTNCCIACKLEDEEDEVGQT